MPALPTSHTIGSITLTRHGRGRALVLIHGWGGAGADWQALIPALSAAHQVLALTLPGDMPDMRGLGQAVGQVLTALDLHDALLIGHSMGGPVAIEAAIVAPDRVAGVLGLDTLADRVFYGGTEEAEIARRRADFTADLPGETARMLRRITAPSTSDAQVADLTCSILARHAPEVLADLRDALFRWRLVDRLVLLRCPLRLLNSRAVTAAHDLAPIPLLRAIPSRIYGEGHFPHLEDPAALLPLLQAELALFPPEPR